MKKKNKKNEENQKNREKEEEGCRNPPILNLPPSTPKVKHEKDEVSFEFFDDVQHHQCNDMLYDVQHIDFVFGDRFDEHARSNSSKNSIYALFRFCVHSNKLVDFALTCELCWIRKRMKKNRFLQAWKIFDRKFNENQVKKPKKRKGLFYNPCLWSP